jgi:GT2 family glycosyltransferase
MKLSYVIVTHNRREPLLRTLAILRSTATTPLPPGEWETWVVDNASTDGTADAVRRQFPDVRVIERRRNEGVWARSHAFAPAAGQYVILLDDDSYPIGDTVSESLAYLESRPRCAAVVGRVVLPDGSCEACALPSVMLSGAVCIRRSVLLEVGGFRPEFFRKAGEYDLSFRIWQAGYSVERFEDVLYRHDKVQTGRSAAFAHRMDLRNNLILVERYLPAPLRKEYRRDWTQRYSAIARRDGCRNAARLARCEALLWRFREAVRGRRTLAAATVETVLNLDAQAETVRRWSRLYGVRRVALADFGKNIYATYAACRRAGLEIVAIADNNPAFAGMSYRGIPVLRNEEALASGQEGVIISNVNPAQIDAVERRVRLAFRWPILRLWQPAVLHAERQAAA